MKITFDCAVSSQNGKYCDEPDVYSHEHIFEIEWGSNPLPKKGDTIEFDEIIETWEDKDNLKAQVFYGRTWTIEYANWKFDKKQNLYSPTFYLSESEK